MILSATTVLAQRRIVSPPSFLVLIQISPGISHYVCIVAAVLMG